MLRFLYLASANLIFWSPISTYGRLFTMDCQSGLWEVEPLSAMSPKYTGGSLKSNINCGSSKSFLLAIKKMRSRACGTPIVAELSLNIWTSYPIFSNLSKTSMAYFLALPAISHGTFSIITTFGFSFSTVSQNTRTSSSNTCFFCPSLNIFCFPQVSSRCHAIENALQGGEPSKMSKWYNSSGRSVRRLKSLMSSR